MRNKNMEKKIARKSWWTAATLGQNLFPLDLKIKASRENWIIQIFLKGRSNFFVMTALSALRGRKGDVMETLDLRQIFFFPPGALRRVRMGLMLRMSRVGGFCFTPFRASQGDIGWIIFFPVGGFFNDIGWIIFLDLVNS
jgi:hypothetical protein